MRFFWQKKNKEDETDEVTSPVGEAAETAEADEGAGTEEAEAEAEPETADEAAAEAAEEVPADIETDALSADEAAAGAETDAVPAEAEPAEVEEGGSRDESEDESKDEAEDESGNEAEGESGNEPGDEPVDEAAAAAETEPENKKAGFFSRLFGGLGKTRRQLTGSLGRLFSSYDRIDDDFYDELEEIMVMGDMGIHTTDEILDSLRERVAEEKIKDPKECRGILIDSIKEKMAVKEADYAFEREPSVILMIGVNGTGKTTSAGKLASILKAQGRKVILAAADTFRAAACEQLREWSNRAGVELISGQEGADPASVVYDAVAAAKARKADVLICDTAGRLHNKKNLMDELSKIYRIIGREYPDAHLETLLVLDGTTGQNALVQAREFSEAADVTGIVLTKLDGTAKGGIAVAIQSELQVPVKYIGVGETLEDLQKFDPDSFVDALFEERDEEE